MVFHYLKALGTFQNVSVPLSSLKRIYVELKRSNSTYPHISTYWTIAIEQQFLVMVHVTLASFRKFKQSSKHFFVNNLERASAFNKIVVKLNVPQIKGQVLIYECFMDILILWKYTGLIFMLRQYLFPTSQYS